MTMGAAEKWGHGKLAGQVINKQTVPLEMNSCQRPRNAGDFQNGALLHSPGPLTYHGAPSSLDHECPNPLGGALCHVYISVVSVNKVVNKAPIPRLDGTVTKLTLYSDGQRISAVSYVSCCGDVDLPLSSRWSTFVAKEFSTFLSLVEVVSGEPETA